MINVLSFYTPNLNEVGCLNAKRWENYCNLHNYEWICHRPLSLDHHPFWQKIYYINDILQQSYDDLLWTDIDVLIRNPHYDLKTILEKSDADILISSDEWGLCAGFMMIRNSYWAQQFYGHLLFLGDLKTELQHSLYANLLGDQNTMKYIYDGFPAVSSHFHLLGEDVVSCPQTKDPIAPFHHGWINGGRNSASILNDLRTE